MRPAATICPFLFRASGSRALMGTERLANAPHRGRDGLTLFSPVKELIATSLPRNLRDILVDMYIANKWNLLKGRSEPSALQRR